MESQTLQSAWAFQSLGGLPQGGMLEVESLHKDKTESWFYSTKYKKKKTKQDSALCQCSLANKN